MWLGACQADRGSRNPKNKISLTYKVRRVCMADTVKKKKKKISFSAVSNWRFGD